MSYMGSLLPSFHLSRPSCFFLFPPSLPSLSLFRRVTCEKFEPHFQTCMLLCFIPRTRKREEGGKERQNLFWFVCFTLQGSREDKTSYSCTETEGCGERSWDREEKGSYRYLDLFVMNVSDYRYCDFVLFFFF